MTVNKPVGDNARKGAVKKGTQLKNPDQDCNQAQQGGGPVHGRQEVREKIQGRAPGEVDWAKSPSPLSRPASRF